LESRTAEQLPLDYECLAQETEDGVPLKINLTAKSHAASTSGTSDSDGDSKPVKTDKVRENKPAVTVSKPKIIRDEFGWTLMTDEAGKSYDFNLQLTLQYPWFSQYDVINMQKVICAQQTNSVTSVTTSDSVTPCH
jgi:hypothetical protein